MNRARFECVGLMLLALAMAVPAAAESGTEPSFAIESIRFEGLRLLSARAVQAQSLLEPGKTYLEPELRDAISRIRRLPFVVEVDFRLARGSERGLFELVISITETHRFFFGIDLIAASEDYEWLVDRTGIDLPEFDRPCLGLDCDEDHSVVASAGIRQAIGSTGVLWGATQARFEGSGLGALELGYTQYDLWGSGAFATATVARSNQNRWWYTLETGIPIRANHSLRLLLDGYSTDLRDSASSMKETRFDLNLEWRIDSRDDPLFPSAGRLLSTALRREYRKYEYQQYSSAGLRDQLNRGSDILALESTGLWFGSLGRRSVLSWGGGLYLGQGDIHFSYWGSEDEDSVDLIATAQGQIGYLRSLWSAGSSGSSEPRDLRWENNLVARYGWARLNISGDYRIDMRQLTFSTSLVMRNRWGVFRLALLYRDTDGGRQ